MSDDVEIEPRSFDLGVLSERVAQATRKIDDDRKALEDRIRAANRKRRWWTAAAITSGFLGLVGIVIGVVAVDGIAKINTERHARTVTSCEQAAENAVRDNAQDVADIVSDQVLLNIVRGVIDRTQDPGTAAFFDPFADQIEANIADREANLQLVRDCSPEGIKAFFDSNGDDGYLP